jgi:hypothetical protein
MGTRDQPVRTVGQNTGPSSVRVNNRPLKEQLLQDGRNEGPTDGLMLCYVD